MHVIVIIFVVKCSLNSHDIADSKIEFSTFKGSSKRNKKGAEVEKETEMIEGDVPIIGEGIPAVIVIDSEPVTNLETQPLTDKQEEKSEEKKEDTKSEQQNTKQDKADVQSSITESPATATTKTETAAPSAIDDHKSFSKDSINNQDTSAQTVNPKPLETTVATDGKMEPQQQQETPKETPTAGSITTGESEEGEKKKGEPKLDEGGEEVKEKLEKEEGKEKQPEEAAQNLNTDLLNKSTDVFNMQLGAFLDMLQGDTKDNETKTAL